jgi:hypothetical protein
MRGQPKDKRRPGVEVRAIRKEDFGECEALCKKDHGIEHLYELQDGLKSLSPLAAWREGRITVYTLDLRLWPRNHAVADNDVDMEVVLLGATAINSEPLTFPLPVGQASFFRRCLAERFRALIPMTLMAMGKY